jgi:prepilin-type N-terminal cleavage/methylation domain-containing protein
MFHLKKSRGFTLIEILIVVAIIGTLGTWLIMLINPGQQFKKGRDAQRKSDIRQMQTALELYRSDNGSYPTDMPACGERFYIGDTTYLQKMPCDPKSSGEFFYDYNQTSSSTYEINACLENITDPQRDATNNTSYCSGGSLNWSYTQTNP